VTVEAGKAGQTPDLTTFCTDRILIKKITETHFMIILIYYRRATTLTSTWCLLGTFRALRGSGEPRRVTTGSIFWGRGGYNNGV